MKVFAFSFRPIRDRTDERKCTRRLNECRDETEVKEKTSLTNKILPYLLYPRIGLG